MGATAAGLWVRLALDHHYSHRIPEQLRDQGHDVVAALERGWHVASDADLLESCVDENRTLLTNNVADFIVIARRWAEQGRDHAGLVFTSDASLPRTTATIGTYVARMAQLLEHNHGDRSFLNRVHWL